MASEGIEFIFTYVFLLIFCDCVFGEAKKGRIVIAGLFPLSGVPESVIGRGCTPAVDLAVDMINNRHDLLPDHNLQIVPSDTKVNLR
jgi:hypothetical protein